MKKAFAVIITSILMMCLMVSCGEKTMRIANLDQSTNSFSFIDTSSGEEIEYDKLILDGQEVIDYAISSNAFADSIMFATKEGQIVREGNRTEFSDMTAYTTEAELIYELKDGVLTIIGVKE